MCFSDDDIFGIASPIASPIVPEYDLPEFPQIENKSLPIPQIDPQQHRSYPISRKCPPRQEQPPEPVPAEELLEEESESESESEYEVEDVLDREYRYDSNTGKNCHFYLLKFKGYSKEDAEWKPSYECKGCRNLIDSYNHRINNRNFREKIPVELKIEKAQQMIAERRKQLKELKKDPQRNRREIGILTATISRAERQIRIWKHPEEQPKPVPPPEPSQEDKKKMLIEGFKKMQDLFGQMLSFLE